MAKDMGTYVNRNSKELDEDDIVYVIYSSEKYEFLYISRLDDKQRIKITSILY